MKTLVSKSLLTACLCLLSASLGHATPDAELKISMTGYFQAKVSKSNKFLNGKVGKTRISTKQILKLISQESGRNIPRGSKLMANEDGTTRVVDSQGKNVLNSSPYVQVRFYRDSEIIDGVRNINTGKENSRSYFKIVLGMNLNSLNGTANGMAISKNRTTAPDRDGIQKWKISLQSQVNGRGEINGGSGFYDGKINLNGRGAIIQ